VICFDSANTHMSSSRGCERATLICCVRVGSRGGWATSPWLTPPALICLKQVCLRRRACTQPAATNAHMQGKTSLHICSRSKCTCLSNLITHLASARASLPLAVALHQEHTPAGRR
jgi:hypothetical protein